jgi:asparagine synthetase B (glutamine-hydrolysing)
MCECGHCIHTVRAVYANLSLSPPSLAHAGYGRHRTTFLKGGEQALATELEMDLNRLHTRNLGRDDRCMSDHGREAWFPYLDEEVVAYLHSLSLREIADLSQPLGSGDKMILRRAAQSVGLTNCTELVKRAVQFGTRIAKHTNIREHGSNRKGSGVTKI